jgi:hypothetical protein
MSGGIGRQLKAAAMFLMIFVFLLAAFTGTTAGKASARASQRAYMTTSPNSWEPEGFNVTGTAAKSVVDHMGWNVSRTFGNVGIGDGSVRAFNMSSNVNDINYTDKYFMAGDVTAAPWDPTRIKDFSMPEVNIPEYNNTTLTSKNTSEAEANLEPKDIVSDNNAESTSKGEQEANKTGEVSFGEIGGNIALNDPFHSILFGRPIGDLLYEHPHGISANMYSRLVGLRVPGGSYANVGMRAIGYGY